MTGDRWTFLVVRGEDTPTQQFTLSARTIRRAVVAAALGVLVIIGLGILAAVDGTARLQARNLEARNQALVSEITKFRGRIGDLESTLEELAEQDARIRTLAGLETIDPEVMQVGIGGPGLGSLESHPLWSVDSTASKRAFALSYDLNALERRARLLSLSLHEATDSLQAHRDLMESTPSILPTAGWLSSAFSRSRVHPVHHRPLPHPGLDVAAEKGTPIFAAAKGRVIRAGWVVGYGMTVEIDHGFGYRTLYGHASKLVVRRGQLVRRGDVIAHVGQTGTATAPHLHYEVSVNGVPQNPANFILPESVP
jgi:murein DD-endopeptidase MepM/ murein hydrolase activator NlpD